MQTTLKITDQGIEFWSLGRASGSLHNTSYPGSNQEAAQISSSSCRPCSCHRASCRHASFHLSWSFWTSSTSCPFSFHLSSFHLSSCRLSSCRLFSCHRASSDPASCRPVSSRPASYRRSERRQRGTRKEDTWP